MKRLMCGLVVVTISAALWSCNGDPTGDIRGQGKHVVADPTHVVLGLGSQKFVTLQELDAQGNQEVVDFQVRNVGPGLTVVLDTTFLQTTIGTHLQTTQRFIVTGTALVNTSFTVETSGDTLQIPVTVAPIEVSPTFSLTTPTPNQPVTVTAPPGYKFLPGAFITFGADTGVVLSRSPDSTSFTFVPVPSLPDPNENPPTPKFRIGTIDSVVADYIPGAPLRLPTSDSILVPLMDTLPSDNPSTAPAILVPLLGEVSALFDAGSFTGADVSGDCDVACPSPAQYYQFTLTEPATVNITLNWANTSDLDLVLCADPGCNPATTNFVAAGASQPETGDYNLTPGTYYIVAVMFDALADPLVPAAIPPKISITMTRLD